MNGWICLAGLLIGYLVSYLFHSQRKTVERNNIRFFLLSLSRQEGLISENESYLPENKLRAKHRKELLEELSDRIQKLEHSIVIKNKYGRL